MNLKTTALHWYRAYDALLKRPDVAPAWTLTTPLAVIALYLLSTSLYRFASGTFPEITYLGPQAYFLLALLALRATGRLRFREIGLFPEYMKQNLLYALAAGLLPYVAALGLLGVLVAANALWPFVPPYYEIFTNRPIQPGLLFGLCLVVFAPVCEELVFRGLLFPALLKEMSLLRAVLVNALVFMAAHQIFHPGAFILGVLASLIFYSTRSVIPTIALHAACNATGILIPKFSPFLFHSLRFLYQ